MCDTDGVVREMLGGMIVLLDDADEEEEDDDVEIEAAMAVELRDEEDGARRAAGLDRTMGVLAAVTEAL